MTSPIAPDPSHGLPRRRSALAIAAVLAAGGALLVTGLTGGASATPVSHPAAEAAATSPAARTGMIRTAQAQASATADALGLGAREKLVVKDVVKDANGTVHTRYERTYAGLPVLGGDLVVHRTGAGKSSVTRATSAKIAVAPRTIAAAAAPKGVRKVVWAASGTPKLAFEKLVRGRADDGTPTRLHIITDAATGRKLFQYDAINTGTGESEYSGQVDLGTKKGSNGYDLTDDSRGVHSTYDLNGAEDGKGTLFTDEDDKWGTGKPDNRQTAAVDAAYGAQETWDFYKSTFHRNGIRNDGKAALSRVHYGKAYQNAFWDDDCFCMSYGDGKDDKQPLTSLDVAGHEMTHGVTAATAELTMGAESGSLNESTSDIFGSMVEFYAGNKTDPGDYLIGENINLGGDGKPLRYMDKPSKDGKSKDYWDTTPVDAHYGSGIGNHFFYLLAEGSGAKEINGVKYDSPTKDGSKITGIGRDKAAQIWFKALSEYFVSNTNYHGARDATIKAATDLYEANSTEVKTVEAAWKAVDVV